MDDVVRQQQYAMEIGDYLAIFRRRKLVFTLPFMVILTIALLIAFLLPPIYSSEATILIERQEIPQQVIATTITGFVQERIEGIRQRLTTFDNLVEIANKLDLFPELRRKGEMSEVVELMRKNIIVAMVDVKASDPGTKGKNPGIATVAFTVGFEANKAELAQKVAAELSERYLEENRIARREQAAEVTQFLDKELERLRVEIVNYEKALAAFKQEQQEQLPELMNMNLRLYEKTDEQIQGSKERIVALEDRISALEAELALTKPLLPPETSEGKKIQLPSERLSGLTAQFLELSARYSPKHPDIIKLSREIEALGHQVEGGAEINTLVAKLMLLRNDLSEARQKYSEEHPDVKALEKKVTEVEKGLLNIYVKKSKTNPNIPVEPDNPRYVNLQSQLESAHSNLKEERSKLRMYEEKNKEYEKRLFQTPVVERDYQSLSRDYTNAKAKYAELKDKQIEARLSEQLESGNKGERFVLAGKAYLPTSPDKPNRLGIALLGGLLAFSGGLGFVAAAEYTDQSVRGRKGVFSLFGAPPIVVIPYIENSQDLSKKRKRRLRWLIGILIFLIALFVSIDLFIDPLDILWYRLLNMLGISYESVG